MALDSAKKPPPLSLPTSLRCFFLPIALLMLLPATQSIGAFARYRAPMDSNVTWLFETKKDSALSPHSKIFLKDPHGRFLIQSNVNAEFHVLARSDFPEYKVPAAAVTACSGFFAGQGEDLYVLRRGKKLRIMVRRTDEEAPTTSYKLLKSISSP